MIEAFSYRFYEINRSLILFLLVALHITILANNATAQNKITKETNKSETQTPSNVVQLVWSLSEKGEIDKAGELMTNCSPITGTRGKEYACGTVALDTEPKYIYKTKQKLKKILSERINGFKAIVVAEVTLTNGRSMKLLHEICKIKGEWKILSIYPDFIK